MSVERLQMKLFLFPDKFEKKFAENLTMLYA